MGVKRIGILTGGGDVPGLNSVIKTVVYRGSEMGCEVIGIRRGWEGLTHVNLEEPASRTRYILPLNRENTRTIDRTGGTRSEEHTSELQSLRHLVCRLLLEKNKQTAFPLPSSASPEGNGHSPGSEIGS